MTSGRLGPLAALPAVGCRRFLERCASRHLGQSVRHARLDEEKDLAMRTPEQLSDRFWLDVRQARNRIDSGTRSCPLCAVDIRVDARLKVGYCSDLRSHLRSSWSPWSESRRHKTGFLVDWLA